jgi:hypothetical protein
MSLKVIGAGVGRTGTYTLRTALNEFGLGPTHHMEEILLNAPVQFPLWLGALQPNPNWPAIYAGYNSAVDWPTAGFTSELVKAYPDAKFVLTVRSPESWAESFGETIYKLLQGRDQAPPHMQPWIDWAAAVIKKTGFPAGLDRAGLIKAFEAHTAKVKAAVPAKNLLVYEVKQGWEPLCKFLGVPVLAKEFPRTNDRGEFWERVKAGSAPPAA